MLLAGCSSILLFLAVGTFRRLRPAAITVGQTTFFLADSVTARQRDRQRLHEAMHRLQFREYGFWPFVVAYVFDQQRRLDWEAEALSAELCAVRLSEPYRVGALQRQQAYALQQYWLLRPVSHAAADATLRRAYRGGLACPVLTQRLREAGEVVPSDGLPGAAASRAAVP